MVIVKATKDCELMSYPMGNSKSRWEVQKKLLKAGVMLAGGTPAEFAAALLSHADANVRSRDIFNADRERQLLAESRLSVTTAFERRAHECHADASGRSNDLSKPTVASCTIAGEPLTAEPRTTASAGCRHPRDRYERVLPRRAGRSC